MAPVVKVSGESAALRLANATPYALSAAVATRDVERGNEFAEAVQAGMTHLNDLPVKDLTAFPFGGEKNDGTRRYNRQWAIEEFSTVHGVCVLCAPIRYTKAGQVNKHLIVSAMRLSGEGSPVPHWFGCRPAKSPRREGPSPEAPGVFTNPANWTGLSATPDAAPLKRLLRFFQQTDGQTDSQPQLDG